MEAEEMAKFLRQGDFNDPEGRAEQDRALTPEEKADDAIDFDDDDLGSLPDEETPEEHAGDTNGYTGLDEKHGLVRAVESAHVNGYHEPSSDHVADESMANGFTDDYDDLFGEDTQDDSMASPADGKQAALGFAPPNRTNSLALPSTSLPSGYVPAYSQALQPQLRFSPESQSPPFFDQPDGEQMSPPPVQGIDALLNDPDPKVREQALLMQASRNSAEPPAALDTDMSLFYTLFPGYEQDEPPRFVELFPIRPGKYNGRAPLKPPKPVNPTKLSLDIQPDHERTFKSISTGKSQDTIAEQNGVISLGQGPSAVDFSEDELEFDVVDEKEMIGGLSYEDIAMTCEDWEVPSLDSTSDMGETQADHHEMEDLMDTDFKFEDRAAKKRKTGHFTLDNIFTAQHTYLSLEDPERSSAKLARAVALDMNDPNLLIDEQAPNTASKKRRRAPGDFRRDAALTRDIARRYNISNDEAYELLKENHQHKVRSTLGSMAAEHSLPAAKLQYPFYKVRLDGKQLRSFHRPPLTLHDVSRREIRFSKPKHQKRKHIKGKDAKELFAKAEDLTLGDNSSILMLEYSEEVPATLSNFGMGSRLTNYYRKREADDSERPKRELGETQVLMEEDKSPFANFGHVNKGETVPTIQNSLYRAPVFEHQAKPTDFLVAVSSTHALGKKYYVRNVENLHTVGQQLPSSEVPGEHSRKVTDASKKRLRNISWRIYAKHIDPLRKGKKLDNQTIQQHLPGSDIAQNRGKMREFMDYVKETQSWQPKVSIPLPDPETIRAQIKPEDVCLLDSMQVGVQHLADLGLGKEQEVDDEEDFKEGTNIEVQLAPWQTTKNFLAACQGKAMLQLHGEGDPTGRGEAFSFVKTSMKGGFRALGESVEDKITAKKLKEFNGHSYNVAKQDQVYKESINKIWEAQKSSLSNENEYSDTEMEDVDEPESAHPYGGRATPRSSFGTPAAFARHDDESASQFSKLSAERGNKTLLIKRTVKDKFGNVVAPTITPVHDPRVIRAYEKRRKAKHIEKLGYVQCLTHFLTRSSTDILL